jgi:5-methylcytosine-specific restriction endonuclease McrA
MLDPDELSLLTDAERAQVRSAEIAREVEIEFAERERERQLAEQYLAPHGASQGSRREAIPPAVRREVWQRDQGRCVDCGSRERLEYDHIIPVSKGGSNTARNIELRCEPCNRKKGARI